MIAGHGVRFMQSALDTWEPPWRPHLQRPAVASFRSPPLRGRTVWSGGSRSGGEK